MNHTIREPLPVDPFLQWAAAREQEIGQPALITEIGWHPDNGARLLYRWRTERIGGVVERATVEDALHRADVDFHHIYPNREPAIVYIHEPGVQRLMTDKQVVAAHTLYVRRKMTMITLADLLWERYGYRSSASCSKAISIAFSGLGLPARQCSGTRRDGLRCTRPPCAGVDLCPEHRPGRRPSHIGGRASSFVTAERAWHPSPDLIAKACRLHVDEGVSFRQLGVRLLDEVPIKSADHLAHRLAAIAARDGWHRNRYEWRAA